MKHAGGNLLRGRIKEGGWIDICRLPEAGGGDEGTVFASRCPCQLTPGRYAVVERRGGVGGLRVVSQLGSGSSIRLLPCLIVVPRLVISTSSNATYTCIYLKHARCVLALQAHRTCVGHHCTRWMSSRYAACAAAEAFGTAIRFYCAAASSAHPTTLMVAG